MKVARHNVGASHSEVQCSTNAHPVHPTSDPPETVSDNLTHSMQHFNNLPVRQWVDIPGGHVTIDDIAQMHVRMWCHSDEWKGGLLWDYVKLQNLDQLGLSERTAQMERMTHGPDAVQNVVQRASNAVEAAVDSVQAACRLQ